MNWLSGFGSRACRSSSLTGSSPCPAPSRPPNSSPRSIRHRPGRRSLSPKLGPDLVELGLPLGRYRAAEVHEDLQGGGTRPVEELKAPGGGTVHVTGLFH